MKCFIDWCNSNQGFAMIILTLAYVIATLLIFLSQKKLFKYSTTPSIIVDFAPPYDDNLVLIVQNIGNGIAKNIEVEFNETFKGISGKVDFKVRFQGRNFPLLLPKADIRTYVDKFHEYCKHSEPLKLTGRLKYQDSKGKKFIEAININLEAYKGLFAVEAYDLSDLVKEFQKFASVFTNSSNKLCKLGESISIALDETQNKKNGAGTNDD